MKKNIELILNILTLVILGIIIVIQIATDINLVVLVVMTLIFILQMIALILRINEKRK